jgi:hypothetical protein
VGPGDGDLVDVDEEITEDEVAQLLDARQEARWSGDLDDCAWR